MRLLRIPLVPLLLQLSLHAEPRPTDFITYQFLRNSSWTDHVTVFRAIFHTTAIAKMIEFGLGYGTKFFLEHCKEVRSIEIIIQDNQDQQAWFQRCHQLYAHYTNWTAELSKLPSLVAEAELKVLQYNTPPIDTAYQAALTEYIAGQCPAGTYDIAFVDPGIHLRGEIVQALFNRVPIIVAHDTNTHHVYYGWRVIETPHNYIRMHYAHGSGTTIWIERSHHTLIARLTTLCTEAS